MVGDGCRASAPDLTAQRYYCIREQRFSKADHSDMGFAEAFLAKPIAMVIAAIVSRPQFELGHGMCLPSGALDKVVVSIFLIWAHRVSC